MGCRLGLVLLISLLAVIALAGAGVVPPTRSGSGAGDITGYAISNVSYIPDDADPERLAAVEFDLDYAAGQVRARVRDNGPWSVCELTSGNRWRCPFAGEPIAAALTLTVVAVQGNSQQGQETTTGQETITVTGVRYFLDRRSPNVVTSVQITLDRPVYGLSARLNETQPWTACSLASGTTWSCPASSIAVVSSNTGTILSRLELTVQETQASTPFSMLVATYSTNGADKARAVAPPECDPIRTRLQGVRVVSGSNTGSVSYTGPAQLLLGSSYTDTITGTGDSDCILSGGWNNVCCDSLYGEEGDDVLIATLEDNPRDVLLDGGPGYNRCYGTGPTVYRCQEINGHPFSASVDSFVLDANNPNRVTYVFVTVPTDTSISSLRARYGPSLPDWPCTQLSSTRWRCTGTYLYTRNCSPCMTFIQLLYVHDAAPILVRISLYGADKAQLAAPQECNSIRSALQGLQVIGEGGYTGPAQLLLGSSARDSLTATPGSDCILGGGGNDTLRGEAGDDVLIGGPGDDQIDGGPGYDICYGGPGVDTFSDCEVIVQD
jgi:hypothetical protein